ncbi:MAG TPA: Hsp20/alpha crystallin family protein [Methylomirabilota bacterium]|nr:Hsp20/alpha crystallin family protein [Methylomirabilota bacterium]
MKLKLPTLKGRSAHSPRAKSDSTGRGPIKRALMKLKSKSAGRPIPVGGPDLFREFERIRRQMDRLWSSWPAWPRLAVQPMALPDWSPRVDVKEDDKEYLIKAELSGVNKEDVHVTVQDGRLSIRGERKTDVEEKRRTFHRREWSYGTFERTFVLPRGIDTAGITAEFKDGMLWVRVPKSAEIGRRATEVQIQ